VQYLGGNRLALIKNGEEYFPALVAALDAARDEVFLETYIFADDETGSLVCDALARAAARGVRVHLLIDGFGSRGFPKRFAQALESAGAHVLVFLPQSGLIARPRRSRLRRMHRKLASIDAAVAFVGGINIQDDYDKPLDDPRVTAPRYDYAVRITGPLARRIREAAVELWQRVSWAALRRRTAQPPAPAGAARDGTQRAALVIRDSVRHRKDIENAYLSHLASARVEVLIACAYFYPGRTFRRALVDAAARKVRVRLLLQGKVEYPLLHYASRALHGTLVDAGIEIFEYNESLLHAKVAVFDRRMACVGSSNIDPFSLLLAREANLFVDDAGFAAELRNDLEASIRKAATPVTHEHWENLSFFSRARVWIAYGIARVLISLYGFERYH
jgi:cardiolipin synthase A/B